MANFSITTIVFNWCLYICNAKIIDMWLRLISILVLIVLLNVAGYFGVKSLFSASSLLRFQKIASRLFWLVDVVFLLFSIVYAVVIWSGDAPDYIKYRKFFFISGGFTLLWIVKTGFFLFVLLHYSKQILAWVLAKAIKKPPLMVSLQKFRESFVLLKVGAAFGIFLFLVVIHGMLFGKNNFKVENVEVFIQDLPTSFDGLRVVHFSDTHLGSYGSIEPVRKGIEIIAGLHPDLIVFSGDMVNNEAAEAEKFIPLFQKLQPPLGMYSVLGNHDMGDYRRWGTIPEKEMNLERLVEVQQEMGFTALLNQHKFVKVGNDSIMIVGVDNWGEPPFKKYGDLKEALGQNGNFPFKLLISHDPSHWRKEVVPYTDIQLTFSGHTHGFQFGIITPFFKWSPVQWKYPEWNGLYQDGNQYLYVNRGFGYLAFPGRVGVPPEITLITLRRK